MLRKRFRSCPQWTTGVTMRSIRWGRLLTLPGPFVFLMTSVAFGQAGTLLLPLRTVGVSDTTATVARDILAGELESRGLSMLGRGSVPALPSGPRACDEVDCALSLARERQAAQVIFGSLSRLGEKVIVRVRALRVGDTAPYYTDQLSALTEEDLDTIMQRIAEGIAEGRANSARATVESVTRAETETPRRRAGRSGVGLRAGFIFPDGDSYGGDRLTSLRLVYKFEGRGFLIESTALLGLAWRDGSIEWTPVDIFAGRIFGKGDLSGYLGGGLGMCSLHLEREVGCPECVPGTQCACTHTVSEAATTLSADLGGGLLAFRTYGYQIVVDLRYHYVFEEFDKIGGHGAHGIALSFGTSH
jgi:hypothetical protein